MIASTKKFLTILPAAILAAIMLEPFSASAAENLANVTVSPDLRRVIIESSGRIENYNSFELERPPRLVIDIPGVSPGKASKTEPPERTGGLKIEVAESRSGSHVVLEFGGGPVPEHRIRQMDNFLIVFVGDWRAPSASKPSTAAQAPPPRVIADSKPKPKPTAPAPVKPLAKTNRGVPPKVSDLTIKSAQVTDGIIVLKVADRAHPDRLFRINLGVNLDQLGFVSAGIYPLTMNPGLPSQPEMPPQGPPVTGEEQGSKGPRKTLEPVVSAPAAGSPDPSGAIHKSAHPDPVQEGDEASGIGASSDVKPISNRSTGLPKTGPSAAKRSSAKGPRRSPAQSHSSGPVSLQQDADSSGAIQKSPHPNPLPKAEEASGIGALKDGKPISNRDTSGWSVARIPTQPVSETARAILQAHRRAPHLRFETCCFTSPRNPQAATAPHF